jgi:polysaccharide deacetylase family protein (PEP-CTERM system associated)
VKNIFSVDLEDWYQLICRRLSGKLPGSRTDCVDRQLETLLPLLARHKTKATFFVLGMLARSAPALVKRVAAEGHEIACHGDQHNLVYRMSPKEFEDDTRRAKELLEDIAGVPVRGYRAAEFSVRNSSLWALEVLARLGFAYDSSIFPVRHRRYGIPDFDPRVMRYDLPGGLHLTEIPPDHDCRRGQQAAVCRRRLLPVGAALDDSGRDCAAESQGHAGGHVLPSIRVRSGGPGHFPTDASGQLARAPRGHAVQFSPEPGATRPGPKD